MPLAIGIGGKNIQFSGVHAILAIIGFGGLLWLTAIKIVQPEAFVGIATVAVQGYLEYRRTNGGNGREKIPPKNP